MRALVFTRKGLFTVERSSAGWAVVAAAFVGDNVSAVLDDPGSGALYAALSHGHFGAKLHRSSDGGATWSELPAPAYPPKPEGLEDADPIRGTPTPWTLELIWALESGGASRPGRLWAGTVPGGLFRSDDGGASWQLMRGLWDRPERRQWSGGGLDRPGLHSVVVDPRDPDHVLVAVSTGGVWSTRDAGVTWQVGGPGMRAEYLPPERAGDPVTQDVHRLALCAAAPDVLWVQHHNGIFRSTDGAASWKEVVDVAPSAFGFALAVHPERPETAWFIPAIKDERRIPAGGRLVVNRTEDGGRSFVSLTRGLPQTWAYDLVYRHGLDVDGGGQRLIFGTTTGNLFASDDGGESWHTVSHHLPPIHGVRFVREG
jgi:photosystem II stability/assembly factor-like uncharacterized protein